MTQEDKELLLKDLSARLTYGVKVTNGIHTITLTPCSDTLIIIKNEHILPYLRSMSSMTEEEIREFTSLIFISDSTSYGYLKECVLFAIYSAKALDWLNAHHFDYRGLIEKGLAIEAPKDMYK